MENPFSWSSDPVMVKCGENIAMLSRYLRYCEKCGSRKDVRTERVDGRSGWKCLECRWWNWSDPR